MAKSTRGVRPGRRHPTIRAVPGPFLALGRRPPAPELSRAARIRLAMLDWHRSHGENVARTARHFGYSRPTVYRWLARFERFRLESLEDRSSRRSAAGVRPGPSPSSWPSVASASGTPAGARTS